MKDVLGRWGKMKQGPRQTLLPPQVAVVLVLALIEAVVHDRVPWSYHGNAFCYKGLSDFGEHQSCSLASETASSETLRLGLGSIFGNRRKEDKKCRMLFYNGGFLLFSKKPPYFTSEEYQIAEDIFIWLSLGKGKKNQAILMQLQCTYNIISFSSSILFVHTQVVQM